MAMMLLFANCSPYLSGSDDVLAQFCQFSLTFALTIGLLEKASDEFQDPFFGPLLIVSTGANVGLGISVIVSDFVATASPETAEKVTRLTLLKSDKKKTKISRKTVVAPFVNNTIVPVAIDMNETATHNTEGATGNGPARSRAGIEYIKIVTLGFGVTMAEFVEALTEDARLRHQIVYSDDELVQMFSTNGNQTDEEVAAAILNDLQDRIGAREYDEHVLANIAVKAKVSRQQTKPMAAAESREPSFAIAPKTGPRRGSGIIYNRRRSGIEAVVVAKGLAKKARKSTAKRTEL